MTLSICFFLPLDEEFDGSKIRRRKELERARRKALNSSLLQELRGYLFCLLRFSFSFCVPKWPSLYVHVMHSRVHAKPFSNSTPL